MTTQGNVQAVNINDLKRYAPEARVNQPLLSSRDLVTRMNCYEPGQITPLHIHPNDDEVVFCVEGRGAVTFEEQDDVPLLPGTIVSLPAGLAHRIEAAPDSRMVVIYTTNAGYTSVGPSGIRRYERPPSCREDEVRHSRGAGRHPSTFNPKSRSAVLTSPSGGRLGWGWVMLHP